MWFCFEMVQNGDWRLEEAEIEEGLFCVFISGLSVTAESVWPAQP